MYSLTGFGDDMVEAVLARYPRALETAGANLDETLPEWKLLKKLIYKE